MPFVRDEGSGPAVLCLHSNAGTSSQWRALAALLADRHRVIAVDGYGAGKSPEWPDDRGLRLADEVELAASPIALAGERFAPVGHSYGAAVAVKLALMHPARVRSMICTSRAAMPVAGRSTCSCLNAHALGYRGLLSREAR